MSYRIRVKTLNGDILTFRQVQSYEIEKGIITFTDSLRPKTLRFSVTNCEIEEEQ